MQSQATELQIFAGGLNLMPASHLIAQTESLILANTDVRKLNLTPVMTPLLQEAASDNFVYHFNNSFVYYDKFRSNQLYNNVWYWSDVANTGKVYPSGATANLGIAPPPTRLAISSQDPSGGAEGLEGSIKYVYTYYDPLTGSESPPSPPSITLDLIGSEAGKAIAISDIVISSEGYQTRLYRLGGIITAYSAVVTLEPVILSYVDQLDFSEIQAIVLNTLRAYPPPRGLQYLTQHQGRFYGCVDSKLYFSAAGKPDSWYALDFISFDEAITGIVSVANGIIVMTQLKSWLITGITPTQFVKHTLSDSEGCIGFPSIAVNSGAAIWLSTSGFVMSNGSSVQNISLDRLGRFKAITPLGAVFIDKRYYLSFVGALFPSDNLLPSDTLYPGTVVNGEGIKVPPGMLVIDFAMGAPAFSTVTDNTIGQLLLANNELHSINYFEAEASNIVTEDGLYNIVTEDGAYNIVASTSTGIELTKPLGGSELRELSYLSPVLIEGSMGTMKRYEKIRITFSGSLNIVAFDEDSRVFVEETLTSVRRTSTWVGIPVGFNTGYGIQFAITGKCIVDSILYNWTPKEAQ